MNNEKNDEKSISLSDLKLEMESYYSVVSCESDWNTVLRNENYLKRLSQHLNQVMQGGEESSKDEGPDEREPGDKQSAEAEAEAEAGVRVGAGTLQSEGIRFEALQSFTLQEWTAEEEALRNEKIKQIVDLCLLMHRRQSKPFFKAIISWSDVPDLGRRIIFSGGLTQLEREKLLLSCIGGGFLNWAKELIRQGVDLEREGPEVEYQRMNALREAADGGHAELVRYILSQGARVNARCSISGQTALMLAASCGHLQVTEALLEAGADPYIRDNGKCSAMNYLDHLADRDSYARTEGQDKAIEMVKVYLKHGWDIHEKLFKRGGGSESLLIMASRKMPKLFKELLTLGANINDKDSAGDGVLTNAVQGPRCTAALIDQLLEAGADPEELSGRGQAPVDYLMNASGASSEYLKRIAPEIQALIEKKILQKLGPTTVVSRGTPEEVSKGNLKRAL